MEQALTASSPREGTQLMGGSRCWKLLLNFTSLKKTDPERFFFINNEYSL
jgi:hypothetical protein